MVNNTYLKPSVLKYFSYAIRKKIICYLKAFLSRIAKI